MKLKDLPTEQGRIDVAKLQDFMDANGSEIPFIVLEERWKDETKDKTGGLLLDLWTGTDYASKYNLNEDKLEDIVYEDGLIITQKYSKIASGMMAKQLEGMGIDDTEELQKAFFNYRLRSQRTGYARLIPWSRSEKPFEEYPDAE